MSEPLIVGLPAAAIGIACGVGFFLPRARRAAIAAGLFAAILPPLLWQPRGDALHWAVGLVGGINFAMLAVWSLQLWDEAGQLARRRAAARAGLPVAGAAAVALALAWQFNAG